MNAGAHFVGFAKIDDKTLSIPKGFTTAISIGIVYEQAVSDLDVEELHSYLANTKTKIASVLELTAQYLREQDCKTWVPPISETLPDLSSVFSHKRAATVSGLGWIGKNSIFISNKFGCGSRLATVFTDAPVTYGEPVIKSLCGSCDKCVRACPCNAIEGTDWHAGISREELLDPWICKRYRDSFKDELGFSHPCCLCIRNCPRASSHC